MTAIGSWLGMLFGAEPEGSFVEVRWRLRRGAGMGREFIPIRAPRLAETIVARGAETDVYVGVAPRAREDGTRAGVDRVHAIWADVDDAEALARLRAFTPRPSIVVRSGSPDSVHAYWALWPPISPDQAEVANRRIAHAIGADRRAVDAARILRPPDTVNWKGDEPTAVELGYFEAEVHTVEQVVGSLPDPPAERAPARPTGVPRPHASRGSGALDSIPPPVYFEALTGETPCRDGKVRCPLPDHEDRTPSCHVYDDPAQGFYCFGCNRGGTIIDLGAALWSIEPRGAGYHQIRERIEHELRSMARAA
jgi:hypothetical protein